MLGSLGGGQSPPFPGLRQAAASLIPDIRGIGGVLDRSQQEKGQAIEQAIKRLEGLAQQGKASTLLALAGGLLSPTRAGSFGESLGQGFKAAAPEASGALQFEQQRGNLIDQLRVQQAGLPADSIMKRLTLAGQLNRFAGRGSTRQVVPDPNSPTGWSQVTTASDGTEVGRTGGITPPAPIIARAQAILKARKEQGWDPTPEEEQAELWRMIGPNGTMFGPGTGAGAAGAAAPAGAGSTPRPAAGVTPATPDPGVSTTGGERRETPPGPQAVAAAPEADEAILNPLPPPNRRIPPATAKQLSTLDEQNKGAAQAIALIKRARELNPNVYYRGMGNLLGGPPTNARWFPQSQAEATQFFNPDDPRAQATLEYPTVVKQLAAMSAKPLFGGRPTNFDFQKLLEIESNLGQAPQLRENLLSRQQWNFERGLAWNELEASYLAHGRKPPSFTEWDKAYRLRSPEPGPILTGDAATTPRSPVVMTPSPGAGGPTAPSFVGRPQAPGNAQPRNTGWFEQLTPEERQLLTQGAGKRSQPGYQMSPAERALLEKIRKLQQGGG